MNTDSSDPEILAFTDHQLLARGARSAVVRQLHASSAHRDGRLVLLFDAVDGRQIDLDLSGDAAAVADRYPAVQEPDAVAAEEAPKRGRPRLGVVGREVTLLPRHWTWLEGQRGGASAALRRLVDEARRGAAAGDLVRRAQDRSQRFMSAVAGDLPGFEEATRALYAGDQARFMGEIASWPADLRDITTAMAADAFQAPAASGEAGAVTG